MAAVLHLLRAVPDPVAMETIRQQTAAGDHVTLALLEDIDAAALPAGVTVRRVPGDLDYARLLDAIFQSDHVVAW